MRIPPVALLMILAVPLMGSDCSVAARVGGPPPPPGGTNPPPPNGGGGIIIVTSSDPTPTVPTAEALRIERRLVASALAASVWTPPDSRPLVRDSMSWNPESAATTATQIDSLPVEFAAPQAAAVPEPTGFVVFAGGLAVAAHSLRKRRHRP